MKNINLIGISPEIEQCADILLKNRKYSISENGIRIILSKCGNGLKVSKKDGYCVEYNTTTDFCRALNYVLYDIENCTGETLAIAEQRQTETTGIMIDVSRNGVLKVQTVKDIIRRMASMGMNALMLYTEDTYKMDKYPYFGYMRGAYTKDEIREMDEYATLFGIELIPCIQVLSHLDMVLRWPYASEIKDTTWNLMVDEPKTYEFIEEMIKTAKECYKTRKIHIGMDEARWVGLGNYLNKNGYTSRHELISRHLRKVDEILRRYDMEPIMWADMFFRLGSKTGNYYDIEAILPDNISEQIPEKMKLAYWDYYTEDKNVCKKMMEIHQKMNRDIVFFGGSWTWNGTDINYGKAFATTHACVPEVKKAGAKGIYTCLWHDDGTEASNYTALLGLQLYAEYTFYTKVPDEHLKKAFKIFTGYDMEAFLALDFEDIKEAEKFRTEEDDLVNTLSVAKQALHQDVLQGIFDKNFSEFDLKGHYANVISKLNSIENQGDLEYLFEYHRQLADVIYHKCDIGIRLTNAYKNNNKVEMNEIASELQNLVCKTEKLCEMFADCWMKEFKAFGLERMDQRYGGIIMRLKRAVTIIRAYLNGDISNIEELEEERLLFGKGTTPFAYCYKNTLLSGVSYV